MAFATGKLAQGAITGSQGRPNPIIEGRFVMSTVPASILFAAAVAAGFYLEMSLLAGLVKGPLALNAAIFQCLLAYTAYLAARLRRRPAFLPVLLILAALLPFSGHSPWSMAAPAAVALGCLRSGESGSATFIRRLASEILCTGGGLVLVAAFEPQGLLGWTLAVWMFFLIQSLYFVVNDRTRPGAQLHACRDRFEKASARAERALARLTAAGKEGPV
jgi:hypothetical protein